MGIARALDQLALALSPRWGASRMQARATASALSRHYEAATLGRRTAHWPRMNTDANAAQGNALAQLRALARDLVRNNAWARQALQVITDNTVGWGLSAKPSGPAAERMGVAWKAWAESTDCDADGRLTFAGIQSLALRTVAESGEVLIRRRRRQSRDGLALPLALQVLEPDFIDTTRDGLIGEEKGPIIQGVEFDPLGRRIAYWLYPRHPGSSQAVQPDGFTSVRVTASDILHVFRVERPGQVRGASWFAPAIVALRDFDEFEDATLLRQKIAACFAAFVKDVDGAGTTLGEPSAQDPLVETIEPGLVSHLPPGQDITFANPPTTADDGFSTRTLRRIASALALSYEDLTGDYSTVNFSSARMARLKHWAAVHGWRWNMLVPQLCNPVFAWAVEAAVLDPDTRATWTPPPMPMIEPDKEGLALSRMVRAGAKTFSAMIREQGEDPDEHFREYAEDLARLDALGIKLDSDVRAVSQAGLTQERAGAGQGESADGENGETKEPAKTPMNGKPNGKMPMRPAK